MLFEVIAYLLLAIVFALGFGFLHDRNAPKRLSAQRQAIIDAYNRARNKQYRWLKHLAKKHDGINVD